MGVLRKNSAHAERALQLAHTPQGQDVVDFRNTVALGAHYLAIALILDAAHDFIVVCGKLDFAIVDSFHNTPQKAVLTKPCTAQAKTHLKYVLACALGMNLSMNLERKRLHEKLDKQ